MALGLDDEDGNVTKRHRCKEEKNTSFIICRKAPNTLRRPLIGSN